MAFLEWRRFNFFDIIKDVDDGNIAQALGEVRITATSSGHGLLAIGDNEGNVHLVKRNFTISTFRAYNINISLAEMSRTSPFLVTIGEDEAGINPLIKVWNIDKEDRHGHPTCLRISRASLPSRAIQATCLCINKPLTLMAVGFLDGSVLLYRGDIKRERTNKQKLLQEGQQSITGMSFQVSTPKTYLFLVTLTSVDFYDITHKDREIKTRLDTEGCGPRCSLLLDSVQDHFMVCRDKAIYCYSTDGLGPCYAIGGQKIMVQSFRSYIVIIAKPVKAEPQSAQSNTATTTAPPIETQSNKTFDKDHVTLTVLDIQNKFIVFSVPLKEVQSVLTEWGSFYFITGSNTICQLAEKDLQSKLAILFKKNLYDVSIRIARSHHYDEEGLIDIFRTYGDHLYTKGDYNGAIEQYMKTIGKLEPSYVIRKFLASHQIDNLTTYLQALHKQGKATADHTTLLLNCYTKLNQIDKLKEFIMKDREVDFDVEVALNVCRQTSSEDALLLAEKHKLHSWYLKIQIEDNHKYSAALDYMGKLEFNEAVENMIKYGSILMEKAPKETTQFLKKLCTDYRPDNKPLVDLVTLDGSRGPPVDRASPENFIHMFLNNSECLIDFLEHLVQNSTKWSQLVYNTLVEHYLQVWSWTSESEKAVSKLQYEKKVLTLLESPDSNCNRHQALVLCQAANFRPGLLHLYEENKMYQQILQYHLSQGDHKNVLACCRRFGNQDSSLWVQALWAIARDSDTPPELLGEILNVIENKQLLSPLEVVDAVCNLNDAVKVGDIRSYLNSVLQNELKTTDHEKALIDKYTQETGRIRKLIDDLQNSPITFQGSRCSACNSQLELPSIHFLCQHSFHQHCFRSFAEQENECPACLPNNKQILDVIRAQAQNRDLHETFHSQLERAEDGFSLVADYFGRGIFNKFTIIDEPSIRSRSLFSPKSQSVEVSTSSSEKSYKPQMAEPKIKKPERPTELVRQKLSLERYESMLEANLTRDQHTALIPSTDSPNTSFAEAIITDKNKIVSPVSKNPFAKDVYPRSKDPFAKDEYPRSKDPFEYDDYPQSKDPFDEGDENLNPSS